MSPSSSAAADRRCPLCRSRSATPLTPSRVLGRTICHECDSLLGLGFSNYDRPPPAALYPATWVYDRIVELTGLDYLAAKRLWLEEVATFLRGIRDCERDAAQFTRNRGRTPQQALRENREEMVRIDRLLGRGEPGRKE